jgi:hypothetical protein
MAAAAPKHIRRAASRTACGIAFVAGLAAGLLLLDHGVSVVLAGGVAVYVAVLLPLLRLSRLIFGGPLPARRR